jgi:hypothetical protein
MNSGATKTIILVKLLEFSNIQVIRFSFTLQNQPMELFFIAFETETIVC